MSPPPLCAWGAPDRVTADHGRLTGRIGAVSIDHGTNGHGRAVSEAHDSGLCAASTAVRRRFARDLDNLTLATPQLNSPLRS